MPRRPSLLDRALGAVGLKRAPRAGSGRSAYAGAELSRQTADWVFAPLTSANLELKGDLRLLRARSRELVRNVALAKRYVAMVVENVIGPDGIRLQARVKTAAGGLDYDVNAAIEAAWKEWSLPENASVDGMSSWRGLQAQVAAGMAQDGEAIVRIVRHFDNPFGFALQLLDPDQLDHEYSAVLANGNTVRMGVEMNAWGKPVAYHIWNIHPAEYGGHTRVRETVPATDIRHLFLRGRVGQSRGVPWLHAAMKDVHMKAGYQEAEVTAARLGACQMGLITPTDDVVSDPNTQRDALTFEAEPGMFREIPYGKTVTQWSPEHPTTAFGPFMKVIDRSIASAGNVSYNALANDLEGVNYSSMRVGALNERDAWKQLQVYSIEDLHRVVYCEWLKCALLHGALKLPSFDHRKYLAVQWQPRGWAWVDPEKDINAAGREIEMGLNSPQRLCAERGRDFEEILSEISAAKELAAEYGITLITSTQSKPTASGGGSDEDQDGNTGKPAETVSNDDDRARLVHARRLRLARNFG